MEKVSIIIPIYNVDKYLKECLDSIVNQTYKNIEVILINDGSSDNSSKICLDYCEKYENFYYFYQENKGSSAARNTGLAKATGDYVYFLDSDDYIDKYFIENALNNALKNNSDIVVVAINITLKSKILKPSCISGLLTWEAFYRAEFLKRNKLLYKENLDFCEDILFTSEALSLTDKISAEKETKYYYRKTENSLSSKANFEKWNKIILAFKDLYLEKKSNQKLRKKILQTIALSIFYTLIINHKLNFFNKIKLLLLIHKFILQTDIGLIKFNPFEYHIGFIILYSIFNLFYLPSFLIGKYYTISKEQKSL